MTAQKLLKYHIEILSIIISVSFIKILGPISGLQTQCCLKMISQYVCCMCFHCCYVMNINCFPGKVKPGPQDNVKNGFYDEGDEAVNFCLKNKKVEKGRIYQSQSTYDPKNIHLGSMTVYRFNIKCVCNDVSSVNERCSRVLPMSHQGWGGYMGSVGNGFFNKRNGL